MKRKTQKKKNNRISPLKWAVVEVTINHRSWVARNGTGSSHWKGEWTLHPSRPLPCVCVCVCTHAPTLMEGGPGWEGGRRGGEDWENSMTGSNLAIQQNTGQTLPLTLLPSSASHMSQDLHGSFNPLGLNLPICQIKIQPYLKLHDKSKESEIEPSLLITLLSRKMDLSLHLQTPV